MAIGRISGPLLKANLVRDGVDLAFETDLLYLDVTNARIGVNTASPTTDLDVNGTIRATTVQIDDNLDVGVLNLTGNTITSSSDTISFEAGSGSNVVYNSSIIVDDFLISENSIVNTQTNGNIRITPNGTGTIELEKDTNITGDLYVSGNVTADGNIVIGGDVIVGNENTDTVTFNAKIASDIVPDTDVTYDIGSSLKRWKDFYVDRIFATTDISVGDFTFSGNTISTTFSSITFDTPVGQSVIFNSSLLIDDFRIEGNKIATVVTNSNLEIEASGTGKVEILSDTEISGDVDVTGDLNVTGNVVIGGNIVIGDQSTDTITINASIDSDLIPLNDNQFDLGSPSFRWNDVYATNLFTSAINTPTFTVGDLLFQNNEITSAAGQDIVINGAGTGGVSIGNFRITANTITNVVSGAISVLAQTGTGYFKIDTTNGFVPPVGDNAQRPTAYAVLGMTRYNTVSRALEIWDGITWASPAGSAGAVSVAAAEDIAAAYALTLG
jgi:cytoskeletal protein CcmA (bactofilin family)